MRSEADYSISRDISEEEACEINAKQKGKN
jgi:hypothetical protein